MFTSSTALYPCTAVLNIPIANASSTAALLEAGGGSTPGKFEEDMKMKGLLGPNRGKGNPKLNANSRLIKWLEEEGQVYLSESSTWGEAPHPMAISTETKDEITNESSGRGLLARRSINDGDELLRIPMELCITRKSARRTLGKDALQEGINEYLAIACQLIHEKYVMGDESSFAAYIGVLPEVEEVNPTFTWSDEDLSFLQGSPVVAATKSLQMKLRREYDALLGGEDGLIEKYPDRFHKEHFTYENWVWAFTMLFSRAIRLRNLQVGERLAMVPYADLINHSAFSQAFIDARECGDWLFKTGGEEVILYADRGYKQMEQVSEFVAGFHQISCRTSARPNQISWFAIFDVLCILLNRFTSHMVKNQTLSCFCCMVLH